MVRTKSTITFQVTTDLTTLVLYFHETTTALIDNDQGMHGKYPILELYTVHTHSMNSSTHVHMAISISNINNWLWKRLHMNGVALRTCVCVCGHPGSTAVPALRQHLCQLHPGLIL